ncbi:MAG: fumarylacetoacetate hydrolase family protein [Anaerolineae bacterium]|jgi:2-keto-4-pentenoate hydratase/2-oxohepta-3-ene-1,7-dioic acid hydratase in catechol pathway|nr:fumarylacetoacetate hydrolase family protein [Anaerolineae bacterium]
MPLIVSYATPDGPRVGLVVNNTIHTCQGDPFADDTLTPGQPVMPLQAAQLLPPVQPSKIVCLGRNYAAHAAEHSAAVPDEPMLFFKPPSALIGHEQTITFSKAFGRVDQEAELAVIIKTPARNVSREEVLAVVLGYTCANDVSARVYQQKDGQWGRAKGFDTFCPLGPWINTELKDPSDLSIRAYVNGDIRQDSRTSRMVFDVPALIVFISGVMTLLPGDIILTGTPAGVSELHHGDVVEIEIEGIGRLRNPVQVTG